MSEKAILFDTSRCTGCHGCQIACKCWNNLPSPTGLNENVFSGSLQNPPDLNGHTRLIMTYNEQSGGPKGVMWAFGRRSCQHCTDAPCASVCPSGCLVRNEDTGLVEVHADKCVACQYCSTACPFDVPRYDGVQGKVNKCTGCYDRVAQGLAPACVTTCQPEALRFGDRDEMMKLAEEQLARLKENGFEDACIYGAEEMGGLHVISVLKYGVQAHGYVDNPQISAVTTLTNLMKPITGVVSGVAVLGFIGMSALAAGYKRKTLAYNPETGDTLDVNTGDIVKQGDGQDEETVGEHLRDAIDGFKGGNHE